MKKLGYLALMMLCVLFIGACNNGRHAKNYNNAEVNQDGRAFIKGGIAGGLTEIKASGEAITNSSNQRVIALAKMLIDDHTSAGEELKKIEADKKIAGTDTIDAAHQLLISELSKKTGISFDKAYLDLMVKDHTEAVKLFTDATHNTDTEISKFASATLPVIQTHLDSAKALLASFQK
jgi:putative membrane protein